MLCEDPVAEALILGVLDRLNAKLNITPDDVTVGRDTGKDQIPQHVETLGKSDLLGSFVFVLDGDGRPIEADIKKVGGRYGHNLRPLFLPGDASPEAWVYGRLEQDSARYSLRLGVPGLEQQLGNVWQAFANAADRPTNIAENQFHALAEMLQRSPEDLARVIDHEESGSSVLKVFADDLEQEIYRWRRRSGD